MDIFNVISLLGGLALFLYGMKVMGDALEKKVGSRLKSILQKLTDNPLKGFALGLGVTAIIQSSSATTVMVVGFVNSGIMQLNQAIGVIMGANVGTTVTAWLLSLTGLTGDSILVTLLKPSSFSPLFAACGVILYVFVKDVKKKDTGVILLGFAILMLGMQTMSAAVKPLADVPQFTQILTLFNNPLLGVLAGAVLTGIIQSSSASVGILQALSLTGSISYGVAIPIIMGQNIGTCVTALLSSIGTNKNAKRAALVHLYFNIIGVVLFLTAFYLAAVFLQPAFTANAANPAGIAFVHTVFNLLSTAVLLPFSRLLEKLACLTIKDDAKDDTFELLDERFLTAPAFAVEHCSDLTEDMARLTAATLNKSMGLLESFDRLKAQEVLAEEDKADVYEDKLGSYLIKLSQKDLTVSDSLEVSRLLHCIGDFERICDHSVNIMQSAEEINDKNIRFYGDTAAEMAVIAKAVGEITELAVTAFCRRDLDLASQVEPLEQVVDALKVQLKARQVDKLRRGEITSEMGFILTDLVSNYERVADHCSNIAVCLIQIERDSFDTHEYLNEIKTSGSKDFIRLYEVYKSKYALPKSV